MSDEVDRSPGGPQASADDRRDDSRRPIELKVEYKRLNAFFADYTRNISKGGTFIQTTKPLPVGTEFVFKLFVPTMEAPLEIKGLVKWTVSPEDLEESNPAIRIGDGEPGMGIRFIYAHDNERKLIEDAVEKLMVGSLGQLLTTRLMAGPTPADGESGEVDD
jgi:type IV pilus assembly protein PilZ